MSLKKESQALLKALESGSAENLGEIGSLHINHDDECELCEYLADEHEEGADAALLAIARNPNCPDELLLELAEFAATSPGEFGFLCDLIRENPNVSDGTLSVVDEADPDED